MTMSAHERGAAAPLRLRWSGKTDRGKLRANNEDSFLCLQFDSREVHYLGKNGEASTSANDFVFAVSDGMGGAVAGEFASRVTVERITRLLPRSFRQSAVGIEAGFQDVLAELFDQIHRALMFLGESYEECSGMGATLSLGWLTSGWMHFAHIGDSRIYYLPARDGNLRQITNDDTHVGWLFRNQKLNEREARTHPRRTVLQKALGAGHQFIEPQVGAVACGPGDRFLLCTDGLVEGLYDANLHELLARPADGAAAGFDRAGELVAAALAVAGRDNITRTGYRDFARRPLIQTLALCAAAFLAGLIDSVVGGGGLIQLPALLILLPHATPVPDVLGTNKFVGISGTAAAAWNYRRHVKMDWRSVLPAALSGLVLSVCGALSVSHLDPAVLRPMILMLLVAVAIYTFCRKDFGSLHAPRLSPGSRPWLSGLMGGAVGFYDGFFGPGTGSFLIFGFIGIFGFDFLSASAAAKVINTATNCSTVMYFAGTGHVLYRVAVPMAVCNVLGSLAGTRLAILRGSRFVRVFFLAVVAAIICKLAYDLIRP